ncbi:glycosyltransferase [Pseudomonas sp.]|uniref:glycosyltransferase n=1 Tax=Pseudomonas sp. TaxID=306 RepID=UPI00272F6F0C|nr:glycosyltransferase [Pseudomonas sp.]MDP2242728.1 glycosyltransferase [Pseudomonas sp.]
MRRALQDCGARLVLIDGMGAARILLPVISRMPGIHGVVIFHGHASLRRSDLTLLNEFPTARLRVVAVSEVLTAALSHELAIPVTALRSAMEPARFRQNLLERQAARRKLSLDDDCLVMGAVGRLVPDKGFETLIEAFAAVAQEQRVLQLMILGEGESRTILEQRIVELGLEDRVSMPGHRDDVASLYQAFDWVLIPSSAEGLGLVLQEAVMASVPVIVSDLPVFHEQLGESGLYAKAGDTLAWVGGLERCLELDGAKVAERQAHALNAEKAWRRFSNTCEQLLTIE